jgi:hypothetical protein
MASTVGFWVKRVLRWLGQAFVIVVIVLALDYVLLATVFSDMKRSWADGATSYTHAYIPSPLLHHTLAANQNSRRPWGNINYRFLTDRHGFRTGPCAATDEDKDKPAIFAVGDSFTEALGVPYEESFVGLMACDARRQGKAVWNLGVTSYSPLIYQRKIRAAAEELGVKPSEIYVFLDVSDIDDEANVYRVDEHGDIKMTLAYHWFDTGQFLLGNFATFRLAFDLWLKSPFATAGSYGRERASWTFDRKLLDAWGKRGLALAAKNLDVIVDMCRDWQCQITLVVYPWPDNVAAGDPNSIQVTYWRDWAAARGIRFIDGFAPFLRDPADVAVGKYYIRGDTHFNAAGHRLLFEQLRRSAGEF